MLSRGARELKVTCSDRRSGVDELDSSPSVSSAERRGKELGPASERPVSGVSDNVMAVIGATSTESASLCAKLDNEETNDSSQGQRQPSVVGVERGDWLDLVGLN